MRHKAVFDMSKIQFWKQFTTSKQKPIWPVCCIRYVKDTILKAIYNIIAGIVTVVTLYSICQRYNFESNLQRVCGFLLTTSSCIRYVKDTILKAIYNKPVHSIKYCKLYSICQRYNFESNLQPFITILLLSIAVFDMSKIQFWKQFTTLIYRLLLPYLLYSICQRYNFESNLQQRILRRKSVISCIRYVKDTILKAIYNRLIHMFCKKQLYSICQRYNFESNLQRFRCWFSVRISCIRYVKDTILKAIYNPKHTVLSKFAAVFDMSKIQFWKQFTTYTGWFTGKTVLYSICQRYNFESNLQLPSA